MPSLSPVPGRGSSPPGGEEPLVALEVTYGMTLAGPGFHRVTNKAGTGARLSATKGDGSGGSSGSGDVSSVFLWYKRGAGDPVVDVRVLRDGAPPTDGYQLVSKNVIRARSGGGPASHIAVRTASAKAEASGAGAAGAGASATGAAGASGSAGGGDAVAVLEVRVLYDVVGEDGSLEQSAADEAAELGLDLVRPAVDASGTVWIALRRGVARAPAPVAGWDASALVVGDEVDCVVAALDEWASGTVKSVADGGSEVHVSFPEWGDEFDTAVPLPGGASDLAPVGHVMGGPPASRERPRKPGAVWAIEARHVKVVQARVEGLGDPPPHRESYEAFLRDVVLPFTQHCMTAKFPDDAVVAAVQECMEAVVRMVAVAWAGREAILPVHFELLQLLFGADKAFGYYYAHYGYDTTGSVASGRGPSAREDRIAVAPARPVSAWSSNPLYRGGSRGTVRTSKFLLAAIDTFYAAGGFDMYLERVSRDVPPPPAAGADGGSSAATASGSADASAGSGGSGSGGGGADRETLPAASFEEIDGVLAVLETIHKMLSFEFRDDYMPRYKSLTFERLARLPAADLAALGSEDLGALVTRLSSLVSYAGVGRVATSDLEERAERLTVVTGMRLLQDANLENRLRGLGNITMMIRKATAGYAAPLRDRAKWVRPAWLATQFNKSGGVELLVGPVDDAPGAGEGEARDGDGAGASSASGGAEGDADASASRAGVLPPDAAIIERAGPVFAFLAEQGKLSEAYVERLWQLVGSDDDDLSRAAATCLGDSFSHLKYEQMVALCKRLEAIPAAKYNAETVTLIRDFTSAALAAARREYRTNHTYFGVPLLWRAMLDDAPVSNEVSALAQEALLTVLKSSAARADAGAEYLQSCIQNLVTGDSVAQSLHLARKLLEAKSSTGLYSRGSAVRELNEYCQLNCGQGLAATLVTDLERYKINVISALRSELGDDAEPAEGEAAGGDAGGSDAGGRGSARSGTGTGSGSGGDGVGRGGGASVLEGNAAVTDALKAVDASELSSAVTRATAKLRSEGHNGPLEERVFVGKLAHIEAVRIRLDFLKYVLAQSSMTLPFASVRSLWRSCMTLAIAPAEQDLVLVWLRDAVPKSKYPTSSDIIEHRSLPKVFTDLLCEHTLGAASSGSSGSSGGGGTGTGSASGGGGASSAVAAVATSSFAAFDTFQSYFCACNVREGNLTERHFEPQVALSELIGFEQLWRLVLHSTDDRTVSAAVRFLISLYTHLPRREDAGDVWSDFVRRCMAALEEVAVGPAALGGDGGSGGGGGGGGADTDAKPSGDTTYAGVIAIVELLVTFFRELAALPPPRKATPIRTGATSSAWGRPSPPVHVPPGHRRYTVFAYNGATRTGGHTQHTLVLKDDATVGQMRDAIAAEKRHPADQIRIINTYKKEVSAQLDSVELAVACVQIHAVQAFLLPAPEEDTKDHVTPPSAKDADTGGGGSSGAGGADGASSHAAGDARRAEWASSAAAWAAFHDPTWGDDDPRWKPVRVLAHSDAHFHMLVGLVEPELPLSVSERVYSLLQSVPPNEGLVKTCGELLALHTPEEAKWAAYLPVASPLRLLYALLVLERQFRDAQDEGKATRAFVTTGGLPLLLELVLTTVPATLRASPAHRACVAVALKLVALCTEVDAGAGAEDRTLLTSVEGLPAALMRVLRVTVDEASRAGSPSFCTYAREVSGSGVGATGGAESTSAVAAGAGAEAEGDANGSGAGGDGDGDAGGGAGGGGGGAWQSVDAQVIKWVMRLFSNIVVASPELLSMTGGGGGTASAPPPGPQLMESLQGGLLLARSAQVRDMMCDAYVSLCRSAGPEVRRSGLPSPDELAVDALLEGLPQVYPQRHQCQQYFRLLKKLVKVSVRRRSIDAAAVTLKLVRILKTHPVFEVAPGDKDLILRGLLSVTTALFGRDRGDVRRAGQQRSGTPDLDVPPPPLPGDLSRADSMHSLEGTEGRALRREAVALVPQLFYVGLFAMPGDSFDDVGAGLGLGDGGAESLMPVVAAAGKGEPPLCKNPNTRERAFELLSALSLGSVETCSLLLRLLGSHHTVDDRGLSLGGLGRFDLSAGDDAKSTTGFVGIKNLGCICYMNALHQQLFNIPEFREGLLAFEPTGQHSSDMLVQAQRMYTFLKDSEAQYYDPTAFCETFKDSFGERVDVRVQQDASEFLTTFFQQLETTMSGTPSEGLVRSAFGAQQLNRLDASKGRSSVTREFYTFISVNVKGMGTLEAALTDYVSPESVEYSWDTDEKDADGEVVREVDESTQKRSCLYNLPRHLIIHLKRFELDVKTFNTVKVNDRFEFPTRVDMQPYTAAAVEERMRQDAEAAELKAAGGEVEGVEGRTDTPSPTPDGVAAEDGGGGGGVSGADAEGAMVYTLCGVVIHVGSATSGHYYSLIRDRSNPDKWYEFNDTHVSEFDPARLPEEAFGGTDVIEGDTHAGYLRTRTQSQVVDRIKNAFMLVYDRDEPGARNPYALSAGGVTDDDGGGHESSEAAAAARAEVIAANRRHWMRQYVLDKAYTAFVASLLRLHAHDDAATAPSLRRSVSSELRAALVTLDEPDAGAGTLNVAEALRRYSRDDAGDDAGDDARAHERVLQELPVLKAALGVKYMVAALARAKDKSGFTELAPHVGALVATHAGAAAWLVRFCTRASRTWNVVEECVVRSGSREVAEGLLEFITSAVGCLAVASQSSSSSSSSSVATPAPGTASAASRGGAAPGLPAAAGGANTAEDALVEDMLAVLVGLTPAALAAKHCRRVFLGALTRLATAQDAVVAALAHLGLYGALARACSGAEAGVDLLVLTEHLSAVDALAGRVVAAVPLADGDAAGEGKTADAVNAGAGAGSGSSGGSGAAPGGADEKDGDAAAAGAPRAPALASSDITALLALLSALFSRAAVDAASAPAAATAAAAVVLSERDLGCVLAAPFIDALVANVDNSERKQAVRHLLCHISADSARGTEAVVDGITRAIDAGDGPELIRPFRAAAVVLALQDAPEVRAKRLSTMCEQAVNTIMVHGQYRQATELCIDRLFVLAERAPDVERFLRGHAELWSFIPEWLRDTKSLTRSKSLHKPGATTRAKVTLHRDREELAAMAHSLEKPDAALERDEHAYTSDDEPGDLVGCRISIRWKNRAGYTFYPGHITEFDARKVQHHVTYDDGEKKWYSLSNTKVTWRLESDLRAADGSECAVCRAQMPRPSAAAAAASPR